MKQVNHAEDGAFIAAELRSAVRELRLHMDPLQIVTLLADALKAEAASKPDRALDRAVAKGLSVREEAKTGEGGHVSADEAARALGLSKPALLGRYNKGQLVGWRELRQNAVRVPVWQFSEGGMLPGLPEVLGILRGAPHMDDWGRVMFFLNPRQSLGGKRPLDALREGRQKEVERLAWADAE